MIYADNAATMPLCQSARAVIHERLEEYGNPSSPHTLGLRAQRLLKGAREEIKALLGIQQGKLIFNSGGSEGNAQAIFSALKTEKKKIIISAIEHDSVYNSAMALKHFGFEIQIAPVDKMGFVSVEALEKLIDGETALVSIMLANNEIGAIQPIAEIGALCREKRVLFHTDAVQAAGHLEINISDLNCDFLTLSAHKFGGMKGVGALYVGESTEAARLINGGMQENSLRAGTENLIGTASMAAALRESLSDLPEKQKRVALLRDRFLNKLLAFEGIALNGPRENRLCGNANLCFSTNSADALLLGLDSCGICASAGSACRSAEGTPSRVLKAIGLSDSEALSSVRFSFSEHNTEEEIDFIADAIGKIPAASV